MRPVWNGAISFGLVNIPVDLISGEKTTDLKFHMVDARDKERIRYERVNEETGEEVPWNQIAKAYEVTDDNYVIVTDEDFEKADVKATKTIDIEAFVDKAEVEMVYFEKPYFIQARKGGEKAYVLFREALRDSGKVAIARVVIRTREYLAAIFPENDALILDLLRFHHELRTQEDIKIPASVTVKAKEKELALKLIEDMTETWEPEKYKDEYRLALMERIKAKTKGMDLPEEASEGEEETGNVVDIMDLLKQSVDSRKEKSASTDKAAQAKSPRTSAKKSSAKKPAPKKKAPQRKEA